MIKCDYHGFDHENEPCPYCVIDRMRKALKEIASAKNWFHTADEKGGPYTAWRGPSEPDFIAERALLGLEI